MRLSEFKKKKKTHTKYNHTPATFCAFLAQHPQKNSQLEENWVSLFPSTFFFPFLFFVGWLFFFNFSSEIGTPIF